MPVFDSFILNSMFLTLFFIIIKNGNYNFRRKNDAIKKKYDKIAVIQLGLNRFFIISFSICEAKKKIFKFIFVCSINPIISGDRTSTTWIMEINSEHRKK